MASIYSNCYLNLAATHSPDSNGGLFFQRWIPSFNSKLHPKRQSVLSHLVPIQEPTIDGTAKVFVRQGLENAHIDMLIVDGGDRVYSVVETAPLATRAWAYQERLLSPRTVNVHSAELTWDCGSTPSTFDCECGHLKDQEFDLGDFHALQRNSFVGKYSDILMAKEFILTTWFDVVTQFSRLRLIFARDRLPALAGIAKHVANKTQSRAPTWSWASVDLITKRPCSKWINYHFAYDYHGGQWIDDRFEILDWKCETVGSNPHGCVIGGHLLVTGAVMVMTFNYDIFYDLIHNEEESWYFDFDIFDKNNAYIAEGESIVAMLVGVQGDDCSAILLIPARKEDGKYKRVGIVGKRTYEDFEGAEEMEIDII
ncbi:hypothetical protein NA56DRAFT_583965 [Hyaloscypha hepaticicola]|uniref:Heterokaryon incompatibility domain-containing protein n=1 Tax=Hyaloscypha hepaticicola TaxID=2082293 RepID=A0A2J6PKC9_9HELO|nr:hypothetical protein NA56DRAFT_583965 [Hyaloscypha hepaticicola]